MSESPDRVPRYRAGFVVDSVPHSEALQMLIVELGSGTALTKLPYNPALIGDPETRVLHGGAITSLLDSACGIAVTSHPQKFGTIATLDLRIDYMKPAMPDLDVLAFTECYRITKAVAFVRGVAYHTDRDDPIAACTAVFMLGTAKTRAAKAAS